MTETEKDHIVGSLLPLPSSIHNISVNKQGKGRSRLMSGSLCAHSQNALYFVAGVPPNNKATVAENAHGILDMFNITFSFSFPD